MRGEHRKTGNWTEMYREKRGGVRDVEIRTLLQNRVYYTRFCNRVVLYMLHCVLTCSVRKASHSTLSEKSERQKSTWLRSNYGTKLHLHLIRNRRKQGCQSKASHLYGLLKLCCRSDDVELSTETVAWSCPHHLRVCMFTEDISFLWVLAYTAH